MFVDASVIVAILNKEPGWEELEKQLSAATMAKDINISVDIGNGAIEASMNYGKAVGHKADLNFGDCFAYACEGPSVAVALQRQWLFADGSGLKPH
jgi:ribonuclease VapC